MFKSLAVIASVVVMGASADVAAAQNAADSAASQGGRWQFIVNSGTLIPTGAQKDAIKRGKVTAAQLSYALRPSLALTTSFGWARTRDIASVGNPKLDMFSYDAGVEWRAPRLAAGRTFSISPFAGLGAGGRSYHQRHGDVDASHDLAAYASAGSEIGLGQRFSVRLEARDYVSDAGLRRNDVSVMGGLRIKVR